MTKMFSKQSLRAGSAMCRRESHQLSVEELLIFLTRSSLAPWPRITSFSPKSTMSCSDLYPTNTSLNMEVPHSPVLGVTPSAASPVLKPYAMCLIQQQFWWASF